MSSMSYANAGQQPASLSMPGGPATSFNASDNPFSSQAGPGPQSNYVNGGHDSDGNHFEVQNEKAMPQQAPPFPGSPPPQGTPGMAYPMPQPVNMQPPPMQGMQLLPGGNRNALNKKFNSKGERDWSHGLCSCFEDCGTCCLACWCPCVVYGKNKQRIDYLERRGTPRPDGGATFSADCTMHALAGCLGGWGWVLQIGSRGEVRTRYNIRGTVFEDCCISFWCNGCDLVQEHREIQAEEQSFGRPMP